LLSVIVLLVSKVIPLWINLISCAGRVIPNFEKWSLDKPNNEET
jgi:hypothetical protein